MKLPDAPQTFMKIEQLGLLSRFLKHASAWNLVCGIWCHDFFTQKFVQGWSNFSENHLKNSGIFGGQTSKLALTHCI